MLFAFMILCSFAALLFRLLVTCGPTGACGVAAPARALQSLEIRWCGALRFATGSVDQRNQNQCRDSVFGSVFLFKVFVCEAFLGGSVRDVSQNVVSQEASTHAPMIVFVWRVLPRLARACRLARQSANHDGSSSKSVTRVWMSWFSLNVTKQRARIRYMKRCFRQILCLAVDLITFAKPSHSPIKQVNMKKLRPRCCKPEER